MKWVNMIEKMNLVTVIGKLTTVDKNLKTLIKTGLSSPVSAEVGLRYLREDYSESERIPVGILAYDLHNLKNENDLDDASTKLQQVIQRLGVEAVSDQSLLDDDFSCQQLLEEIDSFTNDLASIDQKLKHLEAKKDRIMEFAKLDRLSEVDFDLARLKDLKNFEIVLGTMNYEYEKRIELNYENINALILKVGISGDKALYLFIYPSKIKIQMDSILRSVHFEYKEIIWDYMDYPVKMKQSLKAELEKIIAEEESLRKELDSYKDEHIDRILKCYTHLSLELSLNSFREQVMTDDQHYVAAFWLAENDFAGIKSKLLADTSDLEIVAYDDSIKGVTVPTKLWNNWLFRPFETLVNMYGVPNYKETDPTGFLAVAYMFLFGAMFGDVGQGFVFVLAGFFMVAKKNQPMIGGVLKRIGLSSMVFGVIYDSIFGIEHLISHFLIDKLGLRLLEKIFIEPINNANLMLILAVACGIVLLIIAYLIGIYNRLKNGDIQEGIFGKNGVNGLILFIAFILVGFLAYSNFVPWMIRILVALIILSVLLLFIREPLSNKIMGKLPLYHEGAGAYYLESGFEIFETLLSMFSNGISFIRVGAFAINHVGLFVAFHAIAKIIGSSAGNVLMFILGNLIVIGLEGLIVFIQGLRLVYYELFSKFYQGDGQAFVGITLNDALADKSANS